jgi:hypothetical protein
VAHCILIGRDGGGDLIPRTRICRSCLDNRNWKMWFTLSVCFHYRYLWLMWLHPGRDMEPCSALRSAEHQTVSVAGQVRTAGADLSDVDYMYVEYATSSPGVEEAAGEAPQ